MLSNYLTDLMAWLPGQFQSTRQPGPWLAGSLLLAVLATNAAWFARRTPTARRVMAMPQFSALRWLAIALFWLLPPLLAWQRGAISPYLLGLNEIDWLANLGNGVLPAALIVAATLLGWLVYRRTMRQMAVGYGRPGMLSGTERWLAPVNAALRQWHWAFYWAAAVSWLAAGTGAGAEGTLLWGGSRLYWGAWCGLLMVIVEWVLDPFVRAELRAPGRQEVALRTAALAVATTALFALTRNLWLCLACQVVVETAAAAWWAGPFAAAGLRAEPVDNEEG